MRFTQYQGRYYDSYLGSVEVRHSDARMADVEWGSGEGAPPILTS